MMSLFDVAESGNTELFRDTFGTATFYGQVLPFVESVRSGPSSKRRVLEVTPSVVLPEKKTITDVASGQVYLLSSPSYDWWHGEVLAVKYPILPVEGVHAVRTVEQVLTGSGGDSTVYVDPAYVRRVTAEEQSDYFGGYLLYFSSYYSMTAGTVVNGSGRWYRVRENSRLDDIGLGVAEAVELTSPVVNTSVTRRILDPVTDTTTDTVTAVTAFVEPLYLNFRHESLGYIKIEEGDKAVSVLKSVVPTLVRGDKIGTDGLVMVVKSSGNCWTAQVRGHSA